MQQSVADFLIIYKPNILCLYINAFIYYNLCICPIVFNGSEGSP